MSGGDTELLMILTVLDLQGAAVESLEPAVEEIKSVEEEKEEGITEGDTPTVEEEGKKGRMGRPGKEGSDAEAGEDQEEEEESDAEAGEDQEEEEESDAEAGEEEGGTESDTPFDEGEGKKGRRGRPGEEGSDAEGDGDREEEEVNEAEGDGDTNNKHAYVLVLGGARPKNVDGSSGPVEPNNPAQASNEDMIEFVQTMLKRHGTRVRFVCFDVNYNPDEDTGSEEHAFWVETNKKGDVFANVNKEFSIAYTNELGSDHAPTFSKDIVHHLTIVNFAGNTAGVELAQKLWKKSSPSSGDEAESDETAAPPVLFMEGGCGWNKGLEKAALEFAITKGACIKITEPRSGLWPKVEPSHIVSWFLVIGKLIRYLQDPGDPRYEFTDDSLKWMVDGAKTVLGAMDYRGKEGDRDPARILQIVYAHILVVSDILDRKRLEYDIMVEIDQEMAALVNKYFSGGVSLKNIKEYDNTELQKIKNFITNKDAENHIHVLKEFKTFIASLIYPDSASTLTEFAKAGENHDGEKSGDGEDGKSTGKETGDGEAETEVIIAGKGTRIAAGGGGRGGVWGGEGGRGGSAPKVIVYLNDKRTQPWLKSKTKEGDHTVEFNYNKVHNHAELCNYISNITKTRIFTVTLKAEVNKDVAKSLIQSFELLRYIQPPNTTENGNETHDSGSPKGISNLGNSCYVAASIQLLRRLNTLRPGSVKVDESVNTFHIQSVDDEIRNNRQVNGMVNQPFKVLYNVLNNMLTFSLRKTEQQDLVSVKEFLKTFITADTPRSEPIPGDFNAVKYKGRQDDPSNVLNFFLQFVVPTTANNVGDILGESKREGTRRPFVLLNPGIEGRDPDTEILKKIPLTLNGYRLECIILHAGATIHGGHYMALVRDKNNKWWLCDDSRVSLDTRIEKNQSSNTVPYDSIVNTPAYLLYVDESTGSQEDEAEESSPPNANEVTEREKLVENPDTIGRHFSNFATETITPEMIYNASDHPTDNSKYTFSDFISHAVIPKLLKEDENLSRVATQTISPNPVSPGEVNVSDIRSSAIETLVVDHQFLVNVLYHVKKQHEGERVYYETLETKMKAVLDLVGKKVTYAAFHKPLLVDLYKIFIQSEGDELTLFKPFVKILEDFDVYKYAGNEEYTLHTRTE